MPSASAGSVCADCETSTANLLEIRRRYLCHACFTKYVSTKTLKRMESYRSKNQVGDHQPKLLLPLSGGASSLALLHLLDAQLKRQLEKQRKMAYDLVLVHISSDKQHTHVNKWRTAISGSFPDYNFLPTIPLETIMHYDPEIESDLQSVGLFRQERESDTDIFHKLVSATRTTTVRADLQELLLQRLLIAIAKHHDCESILWGHSDSRLASKTLADVAKGRGGSVPHAIADGPSSWGIAFNYPVRELYKTELEFYVRCQPGNLSDCVMETETETEIQTSIRNMSIDALLAGYIASQGEKYPSIMANVVRTAGKLQVPPVNENQKCRLCRVAIAQTLVEKNLCYGCNRMKQDIIFWNIN